MRCRKVRSFLSTFCRGETSPDITAAIGGHLEQCSSCRREAEVYRSLNEGLKSLPVRKAADDFNARLFQKIAREQFAETRSKAYLPGKIPRFYRPQLISYAVAAVVIIAFGAGLQFGGDFLGGGKPIVTVTQGLRTGDDYLTAQPSDNPFLNERKSIGQTVEQYNRFRQYSRALRAHSDIDGYIGVAAGVSLASQNSESGAGYVPGIRIRPVVRDYLVVPAMPTNNNQGTSY